jgi:hypothetical protein
MYWGWVKLEKDEIKREKTGMFLRIVPGLRNVLCGGTEHYANV